MVERTPPNNPEARVKEILQESGAFLEGHFIYTSGKHGERYVNKSAAYPDTQKVDELCRYMAEPFVGQNVETVVGPAIGGIILAHDVARHLTQIEGRPVYGIFARKTNVGGLEIEEEFRKFVEGGKRVLVAEDILNTGGSAKETVKVTRETGGNVIGVSALVNRGEVTSKDIGDVPLHSLLDIKMQIWEPDNCPLCKKGVPFNTNVGHAKK